MRRRRKARGVLAPTLLLLLTLTSIPAPRVSAWASCAAEARRPTAVLIDGVPYVRAVHLVECRVPVDSIRVVGRLTMDGAVVDRGSRTCAGRVTSCRTTTKHRNPAGTQAWQGTTGGAFTLGGQTHRVRSVRSETLRA